MGAAVRCAVVRSSIPPLGAAEGASLVEFAVSLPLLVVLLVGIFDFGGAFNLKQELNNAAREAARFGAAQPTNDLLNAGTPPSVDAIRYLVDSYLLAAQINDCGLGSVSGSGSYPTWTYTPSGCGGNLILTIQRGCLQAPSLPTCPQETVTSPATNLLVTRVVIQYPFQWHFNNVIQLVAPGSSFALSNIQTDATAANQD
jgi:Flp pilus assembly protein TadG